jgi:hypothetical protein
MKQTGPGTLSYELRKGELNGTVTIGYVGMGHCPNWVDSLYWQDFMFQKIDNGYTIKKAFDRACAYYPKLENYVKFVGDINLKINDERTRNLKYSNNIEFISLLFNWIYSFLSNLTSNFQFIRQ